MTDKIVISNSEVIAAMEKWGGSFVKNLAGAFRHADANNSIKLIDAFPEYWENYKKMAEDEKIRIQKRDQILK